MVDTAAWLCDAVIPEVPVRQWVLTLPYRVRMLCAYEPAACALVRGVLVRAVSGFYQRTVSRAGVPRPRAGAVAFVQRFDSGLRLNVHFHVLWLDGVYGWEPGRGRPEFHAQREVLDADVQQLVQRIRDRVLRALRKAGKWVDAEAAADSDDAGDGLLPGLAAAAVEGRAAHGARAGQRDGRVGRDGGGRRRCSWAELLQRAFGIEVLVCPKCSGVRRVLAAIHDPAAITRVLRAMGLSSSAPEQAGSRAPPAGDGVGDVGEDVAQ